MSVLIYGMKNMIMTIFCCDFDIYVVFRWKKFIHVTQKNN